jgi:hypothetical protein
MDTLTTGGLNFCFPSGLLTATGGETVYDTTVAITSCIDGKLTPRAAVTDGVTPTADFVTGLAFPPLVGGASVANTPGNGCIVVWALQGSTVRCMMGRHERLDMAGNFVNAPQFPTVPASVAPFAYQVLKAGATASATAIVFGTANWNATGFTNVIQNVAVLPSRPQIA